ncbi:hypothetical protein UlMin_007771, partial [Ulmus minor]
KMLPFSRLLYMPMSYLYGKRFVGLITNLVKSLRQELYIQPYHEIDWNKARYTVAKVDQYYPPSWEQDMLWGFLHNFVEPIFKRWPFSMLRDKALQVAIKKINYEDMNSRYLCIASGEKFVSMLACWVENPNSEAFKYHIARIPDYLWVAEDGMKHQANSSQTWDAVLAVQAILSCNLSEEYGETLRKAHEFLKASQVRENPPDNFSAMDRHISKGSWTFSVQDQGWPVSDCTAEGLK